MGKVYASSDWHGHYDIAKKLIDSLAADDTLYFLGDAMDRGDGGLRMLELIFNDPRIIFIKGNHEKFFTRTTPLLLSDDYSANSADLWLFYNGGGKTLDTFELYSEEQILKWVKEIENLPLYKSYTNAKGQEIHLSHAGFTPDSFYCRWGVDYLWDRDHIRETWPHDKESPRDNDYIVHGHTPTQTLRYYHPYDLKYYINNDDPKVAVYAEGHKIDVDLGTIESKKIALLDLDTFEAKYFSE